MPMSDKTNAILLILIAIVLTIGVSVIVCRTIASRYDDRIRVPRGDRMFAALCLVLAVTSMSKAWKMLT